MQNRNQILIQHIQQFVENEKIEELKAIQEIVQAKKFVIKPSLDLLSHIFFKILKNTQIEKIKAERIIFGLFSTILPNLSTKNRIKLLKDIKLGYPIIKLLNSARLLELYYQITLPIADQLPLFRKCILHGIVNTIQSSSANQALFNVYLTCLQKAKDTKLIKDGQYQRIVTQINEAMRSLKSKPISVNLPNDPETVEPQLVAQRERQFQHHIYSQSAFSLFYRLDENDKNKILQKAQQNRFAVGPRA
jgi:hypothetical protein